MGAFGAAGEDVYHCQEAGQGAGGAPHGVECPAAVYARSRIDGFFVC